MKNKTNSTPSLNLNDKKVKRDYLAKMIARLVVGNEPIPKKIIEQFKELDKELLNLKC